MYLDESSLVQLYQSAVNAFPRTAYRQHATQPIRLTEIQWMPFKGMKTLFIKGSVQNENREYSTIVLFKNVRYDVPLNDSSVKIIASDYLPYVFEKLREDVTDVLVRCSCPDFRWRFNWWNAYDKSLYGRKVAPYHKVHGSTRPPANPLELPGMCKHLTKTVEALDHAGIFH